MYKIKSKKGQVNGGLITSLVFGITSLIIGIIIAFVIISTLNSADLLTTGRTTPTVINETGTGDASGYALASAGNTSYIVSGSYALTYAENGSQIVNIANLSVDIAGNVFNATAKEYQILNLTYSYILQSTEEISSDRLTSNFTTGIENVSNKIPTVLLVAAVVLIMGALVLLVGLWQRMRLGGDSL